MGQARGLPPPQVTTSRAPSLTFALTFTLTLPFALTFALAPAQVTTSRARWQTRWRSAAPPRTPMTTTTATGMTTSDPGAISVPSRCDLRDWPPCDPKRDRCDLGNSWSCRAVVMPASQSGRACEFVNCGETRTGQSTAMGTLPTGKHAGKSALSVQQIQLYWYCGCLCAHAI